VITETIKNICITDANEVRNNKCYTNKFHNNFQQQGCKTNNNISNYSSQNCLIHYYDDHNQIDIANF